MKFFIFFCYIANVLIGISAALRSTIPMPHPQNVARQASKTGEMINLINNVVYSDRRNQQSAGYDRFYLSKHPSKRRNHQPITALKEINPWFANMYQMLANEPEETEAEYYKRLADTVRYHVIENPEVLEEYEKKLNEKKKKRDIRRPSYETVDSSEYDTSSEEQKGILYYKRRYVADLRPPYSKVETMESNTNSKELLEDQIDDRTLDGVQEETTFRPSFPDDDDDKTIPGDIDLSVQEKENSEPIIHDYDSPKIEKILTANQNVNFDFKSQRPWDNDEPQVDKEKAHDFSANSPKNNEDSYNSWEKKTSQWVENEGTYTEKEKRDEDDDYNKDKRPIISHHKDVEKLIDGNWKKDSNNKKDSGNVKDKDNINDREKKYKQLHKDVNPDEGSEEQRKQKTLEPFKDKHKKKILAGPSYGLEKGVSIPHKNIKNNTSKGRTPKKENERDMRDDERSKKDKDWNKKHDNKHLWDKRENLNKNEDSNQKDHDWDKKDGRNKKSDNWNKRDKRNKKDDDQNKNNNGWNKKDNRNKKHNDGNKKGKKPDRGDDNYKENLPDKLNNDWGKVGMETTQKQERGQYDANKEEIENTVEGKKKKTNDRGDRREVRQKKKSATTAVIHDSEMVEYYKPNKNKRHDIYERRRF